MIFTDIGNSSIVAAKKVDLNWVKIFKSETGDPERLRDWLELIPRGERIVFASVRKSMTDVVLEFCDKLAIIQITKNGLSEIELSYDTPDTLGIDRVLVCIGATAITGKNVVVIDAGSACTIDMMTADRIFRGGVIMPGLFAQQKAMQQLLPDLPVVDMDIPVTFPGRSTTESIQWGLSGGYIKAIESFVRLYKQEFERLDFFITGGDGPFVQKWINPGFRCKYRPDLIFEGMEELMRIRNNKL